MRPSRAAVFAAAAILAHESNESLAGFANRSLPRLKETKKIRLVPSRVAEAGRIAAPQNITPGTRSSNS